MSRASVLKHSGFRRLWVGDGLSQFGAQFSSIAMPVIAVQLLVATEWEVGILGAASTAAFLLVGLPAGAWVDRMLKRRVMIAADVVRAVTLMAVPVLWLTGALEIWHLILVAAITGIATVFFDVGYQSYVPLLVADSQVGDANSVLQATGEMARVGGPGIAGVVLSVIAAPVLLSVNAAGYVASAFALSTIRDTEVAADRSARRRLHVEIAEGVRFVARQPLIRSVALTTATSNLGSTLLFTLFPLFVLREMDLGPAALGIALSAGAVGGLVGAAATPVVVRVLGEGRAIIASAVTGVIGLAILPLAASAPGLEILVLCIGEAVVSFTVLVYNITQLTLRQRLCPPALLGRMNASIRTLVWGVMPIGSLSAGVLGGSIGLIPTFWVAVAVSAAGCCFVIFSPVRKLSSPTQARAEGA